MSFAQELKDFTAGFKAGYHHPTEADRQRAEGAVGENVGDKKYASATPHGTPNLGTDWLKGDTPGGAVSTPSFGDARSMAALPTVEGGDASSSEMTDAAPGDLARAGISPRYAEQSSLATFARGAKAAGAESDIAAAKAAIAGNESGGRYNAMGPITKSGDRAYGKYQVMGKNIPQWTRAAIGRAMTPQEFVNNPQAQEAVFERYFGDNLKKYGFNDASSIWFSGRRAAQAGNAKDVLGTTVPKYIRMASATFNRLRPVQRFAEGGVVEPTPAAAGNEEGYPLLQDGMARPDITDPYGMGDIADAAIDYGTRVFRLNEGAIPAAAPQAQQGAQALAMNVGAARPEEVKQVEQTVDPEYKLSNSQRQIAKYKAMYDYWMDHNQPERAQRAVFAMSMAAKDAARTYGVVAMQALKRGDTKIAAEALSKGYDEVPDGQTMKITDTNKDGVTFEMHDMNGNITDKGKFAINEMMRVATGMVDGTEFLKQWGQIRERTDKRSAREERDRAAIAAFEQGRLPDDREFIATLSPEQRKRFSDMPWQAQRDFKKRHYDLLEQDRKQLNIENRRGDVVDKREHDDAMKLFGMAVRQNNWEKTREQVMTNAEKGFALKARDLSDRMARYGESREDKLKRWADVDKRILEQRQVRGSSAPKLTASERKEQAVDTQTGSSLAQTNVTPEGATGFDAPDVQAQQAEGRGRILAERTYQQGVMDKQIKPNTLDDEVPKSVEAQFQPKKGMPESEKVQRRDTLTKIAGAIHAANGISPDHAARIAIMASASDVPVSLEPDKANPARVRMRVGPNLVTVNSDILNDLAILRGRAGKATLNAPPRAALPDAGPRPTPTVGVRGNTYNSGTALPGVTGKQPAPQSSVQDPAVQASIERRRALETERTNPYYNPYRFD